MTVPVLELRQVNVHLSAPGGAFTRDKVKALTEADFAVAPGETVGVVGESGCGKSTLARVLVGLQRPTSGSVLLNGTPLGDMPARARRRALGAEVGMIFQDSASALNPRLPVSVILRDPLDVHDRGDRAGRAARVRELMALVGLPARAADALPGQLSGGQRQRVAIARALALDPAVVVADEPTSALDVSVRAQILNLMLDLKDRLGLAVVFVSHDIQTVRRMADRVVSMYLGWIIEETSARPTPDGTGLDGTGPAGGGFASPRHPYTCALVSAAPSLLHDPAPIRLAGPVPSAVHPPSGCPFRTRCWRATDECARTMPGFQADPSESEHRFRCFHPISGAADLPAADSQELT